MKDFSQPLEVTEGDVVFGACGRVNELMPNREDIPEEFWEHGGDAVVHPFTKLASSWFFDGIKVKPKIKPGLDETKVWRHLSAVMRSWASQHEHKIAAAGYLMSLWFEE